MGFWPGDSGLTIAQVGFWPDESGPTNAKVGFWPGVFSPINATKGGALPGGSIFGYFDRHR